jgi:hypothetical protein
VVDRAVDMAARQAIAERLGHGRTQITKTYLGTRVEFVRSSAQFTPPTHQVTPIKSRRCL